MQPAASAMAALAGGGVVATATAVGRQQARRVPSQRQPQPMCAASSAPRPTSSASHRRPAGGARRRLAPLPRAAAMDLASGSIDIESLQYEDGCFSVQGCLLSSAHPDVVYQVLTDYESLTRVFHNVETSELRTCQSTGQPQLVQTCKWAFLVFSGTFVNALNVREDAEARQLTFSLVESAFMREFVGSWEVQHTGRGVTEVRHRLAVRPVVAPPQKIGDLSKKIFKKQVVGILEDLSRELERRA